MITGPYNHPFLSELLSHEEIADFFSAESDVEAMLMVEIALAQACARVGLIPSEAAIVIAEAAQTFQPDYDAMNNATARDGVVVPEFVRQFRRKVGEPYGFNVHFGATSQDIIDTSFALRFKAACQILLRDLDELTDALESLSTRFGSAPLTGRTRMQQALPISAADRIRKWLDPLLRHRARADDALEGAFLASLGGAVGTRHAYEENGDAVCEAFAEELDLMAAANSLHAERDGMADAANWLSLVTGSIGKMGQDIALMTQNEIQEITLDGGGKSSAMPHKQNPVGAEILVTLARFNATQLSGIHHALVHENERSGAAWTLEWMILPNMTVATGASLKNAIKLIDDILVVGNEQE